MNTLRCSFCNKRQSRVRKLISSPREQGRAYICDECVEVCVMLLNEPDPAIIPDMSPGREPEWVDHPAAAELLSRVREWIRREHNKEDASREMQSLRDAAGAMFLTEE